VVARPNNWERRLHNISPARETKSEISERRHEFWDAYVNQVPGELERSGPASYLANRGRIIENPPGLLSMYLSANSVGIYLRAPYGGSHEEMREMLVSNAAILTEKLSVPMTNSDKYFFGDQKKGDYTDPAQRVALIEWLAGKADFYENVLREVFENSQANSLTTNN
jgi:hypothetical protein